MYKYPFCVTGTHTHRSQNPRALYILVVTFDKSPILSILPHFGPPKNTILRFFLTILRASICLAYNPPMAATVDQQTT